MKESDKIIVDTGGPAWFDAFIRFIGGLNHKPESEQEISSKPVYPTTHPLAQADMVFNFTVLSSGAFEFFVYYFGNPDSIPPARRFIFVLVAYILIWLTMRLEYLPNLLKGVFKLIMRLLQNSLRILSQVKADDAKDKVESTKKLARIFPVEMRTADYSYHKGVAARVQILGVLAIAISCWITLYSGGPFMSPYSQIVMAYPLFAVNIARSPKSIALVYLTTIVSMIVIEVAKNRYGYNYPNLSSNWYYIMTGVLLAAACVVAVGTRMIQRPSKIRDAGEIV